MITSLGLLIFAAILYLALWERRQGNLRNFWSSLWDRYKNPPVDWDDELRKLDNNS